MSIVFAAAAAATCWAVLALASRVLNLLETLTASKGSRRISQAPDDMPLDAISTQKETTT